MFCAHGHQSSEFPVVFWSGTCERQSTRIRNWVFFNKAGTIGYVMRCKDDTWLTKNLHLGIISAI